MKTYKNQPRLLLASIFSFWAFNACSEVGPYLGEIESSSKEESLDMNQTSLDMADNSQEDLYEACVPQTKEVVCIDVCGLQPDECGGVFECEPCLCENGEPLQTTCGPCSLGISSCDNLNNHSCNLPEVPDINNLDCVKDIVYVSSIIGAEVPDGSRNAPWPSFAQALLDAKSKESRLIIAMNTTLYEEKPLLSSPGVSIIGGYDNSWSYTPTSKTHITILPNDIESKENTIGLDVIETPRPTLIANLKIETAANTKHGNNIGLRASRASQLILDNVEISAGAASNGVAGESIINRAKNGRNGSNGLKGQTAPEQNSASYDCPFSERVHLRPQEKRKSVTCEENEVLGGRGGYGGCTETLPEAGDKSAANIGEGQAGTMTSKSGTDGVHATSWARASWGEVGSGGRTENRVASGQWDPDGIGGRGGTGTHGAGGGGGGGAYMRDNPYASGPSGGNGGNGGCGGTGGFGGQPGGASIGLLVIDSFGLEIRNNSSFTAGQAGDGGRGGNGGLGGFGGEGGKGTDQACVVTDRGVHPMFYMRYYDDCQTLGYKSGDGGNGADGTPGGPGGGGAGGDSYGIYCHASRVSLHPSTAAKAGEPGQGGMGGAYPIPDEPVMGEQGEPGVAGDIIGCN